MMSSLPCGKFQPSARVSTTTPMRVAAGLEAGGVAFPVEEPEITLRRGDRALQRGVEQVALRIAAQRELETVRGGRAFGARHPCLVRPDGRVGRVVRVEDRPDLLASCRSPAVLLKKAPAVSPA